MERTDMLKQQAKLLRDMAARSEVTYPEIALRMRDLAEQCEKLAVSLSQRFSMADGDFPKKAY